MRVSTFGPLNVVIDGRSFGPSDMGGVKPKELLEILILARGRPVSKEVLADSLWPGKPPKNVPATLETYVSVLRRKLFKDRSTARRVLVTGNASYELSPNHVSVDLDEFDRLLACADGFETNRLELLRQATELAVGDVLEDSPSASWAETDRDIYRDRVTRVNLMVASGYLMEGDYVLAIKHAERALEIRRYSEEAVRVLMLANHGLGQAELSRQVYDRCRALLADELNLDCTTETDDLAGAISAGATIRELLQERACPLAVSPRSTSGSKERRDPQRQIPFIGREVELDRVRKVVERSRHGHFSLVLVHARPGAGRTSFLDQLEASLWGPVGRAGYSPLESEAPKLPLVDAICDALSDLPATVDAERYASSATLCRGDRAFAALDDLLRIDTPMVLLLDDFQWADVDTISMIDRLMSELPELPITIVGTVRDAMLKGRTTIDELTPTDTIRLSGLRADDWKDCDDVERSLVNCAGGSPSLMADCYRWHQAGNSGPSPSLSASILRMTRGLGGKYPELLQAVSVQPVSFGPSDLSRFNGSEKSSTLEALEELCEFEILEQVGEEFRFRSPIVSQVIAKTVA